MREIEIKARLGDKKQLVDVLQQAGVTLTTPISQHDQVFGVAGEPGGKGNHQPWLRIRTETRDGMTKKLFTFKRRVKGELDSIEHETEVANSEEMIAVFLQLGFEPYSDIIKLRQKAFIDGIELCIDEVEGLGLFVEAEKLTTDDADLAEATTELWRLFDRFGIKRKDEVLVGYDVMTKELQDHKKA